MPCHCGSKESFENCCKPFIDGKKHPETAEKLMRSRYSAYVIGNIDYIKATLAHESMDDFDIDATRKWAEKSTWKGLKILSTEDGLEKDSTGVVEFVATYSIDGKALDHHEVSQFKKNKKGHWVFVSGDAHSHPEGEGHHHHSKPTTIVREGPKIGRNDPCPCGSGKKFKKCCGTAA